MLLENFLISLPSCRRDNLLILNTVDVFVVVAIQLVERRDFHIISSLDTSHFLLTVIKCNVLCHLNINYLFTVIAMQRAEHQGRTYYVTKNRRGNAGHWQ